MSCAKKNEEEVAGETGRLGVGERHRVRMGECLELDSTIAGDRREECGIWASAQQSSGCRAVGCSYLHFTDEKSSTPSDCRRWCSQAEWRPPRCGPPTHGFLLSLGPRVDDGRAAPTWPGDVDMAWSVTVALSLEPSWTSRRAVVMLAPGCKVRSFVSR